VKELRQLARRGATVIQMVHHAHLEPNRCGRIPIMVLFIRAFHLSIPDVNIIGALRLFEGERGRPDEVIEAEVSPHVARWLAQHPTPTEEELG
ncbi:MAG: hypothetical protein RIT28_4333, partial [Pseudomonadota bacterium]